jgi:hypothetical protein
MEVKSHRVVHRTASEVLPPALYRPLSNGRRGNFKYFWLALDSAEQSRAATAERRRMLGRRNKRCLYYLNAFGC